MKLTKVPICTLLPKPRAKTHTTKHYTFKVSVFAYTGDVIVA